MKQKLIMILLFCLIFITGFVSNYVFKPPGPMIIKVLHYKNGKLVKQDVFQNDEVKCK